jgi:hypothetical protein
MVQQYLLLVILVLGFIYAFCDINFKYYETKGDLFDFSRYFRAQ